MKTPKLIELQRKRFDLVDEARALVDEIGKARSDQLPALEKRHDANMREIDILDLDIAQERMEAEERDQLGSMRPHSGEEIVVDCGANYGVAPSSSFLSGFSIRSDIWRTKDGQEIRALAQNERFATHEYRGAGLGDIMRAMVTGKRTDAEERALAEGTTTAGGFTVPAPLAAEFIDRLRARSVVMAAGARTVPMTSQTLAIARLETDPEIAWRAENAVVADSDPTFGRVLLTAKSLMGYVKVSRELLDDSVNVGEILQNAITKAAALELDRACLYGTGADNQPEGLAVISGINSVSMGNNGAALTNYDKVIDTIYEMQLDNASDPTAMIYHPRTGAAFAKLKDGQNNPLTVPEMVARVPKLTTTSVPIDETQGTASTASSILTGDFRQMLVGIRDNLTIRVLTERFADNNQVAFIFGLRADMQLAHKASFSKLIGIIP